VDQPSQRPPHGSEGRRVLLPKTVAEKALPTLAGAPLNGSDDLREPDRRHPVGLVTRASIEGGAVHSEGVLFKRNLPDAVARIQANKDQLGLSDAVTDCQVREEHAPVWVRDSFPYTGATILAKSAAAYGTKTSIAAVAAQRQPDGWGIAMRALRRQARVWAGQL
jgi:hypothetical protein